MSQVPDFSKHDHSQITLIVSGASFYFHLFFISVIYFSVQYCWLTCEIEFTFYNFSLNLLFPFLCNNFIVYLGKYI